MLYYLIGTAAILLTIVCIACAFSGHFPSLKFDNKLSLIICRMLLVITGILLVVAACVYPEAVFGEAFYETSIGLLIICTLLNIILFLIAGVIYYVVNLIGIVLLALILFAIEKLGRWILCKD